ncbi:hypothetical protein B0H19DRAFT_1106328 [Mycena capillaripes]|nr:hypothetical protein B0H19DRAFT_1106328 [Mycena capillaripes]
MAKRVRATAQAKDDTQDTHVQSALAKDATKDTNTDTQSTQTPPAPTTTGRPAPVHLDELFAIWPADPRIPSVESRRKWALARNITPSYVHTWWQRRRPAAKRLKLKIPKDTYELPVGTPPVVLVVIKDEPAEPDLEIPATTNDEKAKVETATAATPIPPKKQPKKKAKNANTEAADGAELTKKNLKRKRDEPPSDDVPEPTTQPKNKKKKVSPATTSDIVTTNDSRPKRSHKKIKTEPDIAGEAAALVAPTKESKKKTKKAVVETAADNVPEEVVPPKKNLKRKSNPIPDDVPELPTQSKRKAKKATLESSSASKIAEAEAPTVHPNKKQKKKTVRFDSPSADMPPSSPTLYASSPPPSDSLTVVDDTPTSSPLSKSASNRAHVHHNSVYSQSPSPKDHVDSALNQGTETRAAKAKENSANTPLKSALKTTKPPKKRKAKARSIPAPVLEEEADMPLCCDQGNKDAPTGFTCALCTPRTDEADAAMSSTSHEPKQVFDWAFGFPSFPVPPGDYTGMSIDVTPLSALPFLASPATFLAAKAPPVEVGGLAYDAEGCTELDGLRFSYDGMAVGEDGAGEFFPMLPTGADEWKEFAGGGLLLDNDGNWLSDSVGSSRGDDEDEGVWAGVQGPVLRLPAFEISDSEDEEDG